LRPSDFLPALAASLAAFLIFGVPATAPTKAPAPRVAGGTILGVAPPSPGQPIGARVGGRTSPLGAEIQVDLPGSLHTENIASRGLGCCVFRSLDHAARWQGVPALWGFPEWMVSKRIEGGGYPSKVDRLIPQIAKDRGLPTPEYIQHEGTDLELVRLALKTGRMVSGTYGRSPTGRYGGRHIDHMVNYVHCTSTEAAVLDNNYPGDQAYEWMTPEELRRAAMDGSRQLWVVILLSPPPPPAPRN
jgi:hypothetical protein